MVYACCVPNCRGNYDDKNKVSVFRFPKEIAVQKLWLRKIPRKDFEITAHSRVCEKHFREQDIKRKASYFDEKSGEKLDYTLDRPVLKENAVPIIFLDCPNYLSSASSSREDPVSKRRKLEESQLAEVLKASKESAITYDADNIFHSISDLKLLLGKKVLPDKWQAINNISQVNFLCFSDEDVPNVLYVVTIFENLNMHISYKGQKLLKFNGKKLPLAVGQINDIFHILECLEKQQTDSKDSITYYLEIVESLLSSLRDVVEDKHKVSLDFIIEQLSFLLCKPERFRYSASTLIFSCLLFYISPQAYKFLRQSGNLTLPDPSTLRKISAKLHTTPQYEQSDSMFLMYAKQMISSLQEGQRYVSLMLDEIHIQPYLDYKGGNIVGMSYDSKGLATSAHTFMIQSKLSSFKIVAHIVPVVSLTAENLHALINRVVIGLEQIGYRIFAITTDNNSINRRAMSLFCSPQSLSYVYPHPFDCSRPLFYVIDSVHEVKCLRNNWINQKNGQYMYYPHFDSNTQNVQTASFDSIRKLYELESIY